MKIRNVCPTRGKKNLIKENDIYSAKIVIKFLIFVELIITQLKMNVSDLIMANRKCKMIIFCGFIRIIFICCAFRF